MIHDKVRNKTKKNDIYLHRKQIESLEIMTFSIEFSSYFWWIYLWRLVLFNIEDNAMDEKLANTNYAETNESNIWKRFVLHTCINILCFSVYDEKVQNSTNFHFNAMLCYTHKWNFQT